MSSLKEYVDYCQQEDIGEYLWDKYGEDGYTPKEALDMGWFYNGIIECCHCDYLFKEYETFIDHQQYCPNCGKDAFN